MANLQYNDTTNGYGIIQSCESQCNLGATTISGDTTLLKEFTRYANKTLSKIWSEIFSSYGGWQYDDSNQTNLPQATDTLTSGTSVYAFPTGAVTVRGVEVKNTSGVWEQLIPVTQEQIQQQGAIGEFMKTSAMPRYYQVQGETIKLYPTPNYTQASSFKVFIDRGSVAFQYTDTTNTPGFVSEFHDAVPVGMSIEWLKVHKTDSAVLQEFKLEFQNYLTAIKKFYRARHNQFYPPRMTVRDSFSEFM